MVDSRGHADRQTIVPINLAEADRTTPHSEGATARAAAGTSGRVPFHRTHYRQPRPDRRMRPSFSRSDLHQIDKVVPRLASLN